MLIKMLMFDLLAVALVLTIIGGGYVITLYICEVKKWITQHSKMNWKTITHTKEKKTE